MNSTIPDIKPQEAALRKLKNKKLKKSHKRLISTFACLLLLLPAIPLTNLVLAHEVIKGEETIGFVYCEEVIEQAEVKIDEQLEGEISEVETITETALAIVGTKRLTDADELAEKIVYTNEEIVEAYGIYVDGERVAVNACNTLLQQQISDYKEAQRAAVNADRIAFAESIEVKSCLSLTSELRNVEEISQILSQSTTVKAGRDSVRNIPIPYDSTDVRDDSLYRGVRTVAEAGVRGRIREEITTYYINGQEVNVNVLTSEKVREPQTEVVRVGTKATEAVFRRNATYAWPLAGNVSGTVTSGFGLRRGRLHRGIDIVVAHGTGIVAAMGGRVVRAGWYSAYGKTIDIRHPDGNMTRYAHCSAILVNVGDRVEAGEIIGRVGSTGRSTAPHLHFEVWSGGRPVNPRLYIGQ